MAEEPLKRLLDAEAEAERIIAAAEAERNRIVAGAHQEIQEAERRHATHMQEVRASLLAQADQHARQTVEQLKQRHAENAAALRATAARMEQRALDAAAELLAGSGGGAS